MQSTACGIAAFAAIGCGSPTGGGGSDYSLEIIYLGTAPTGATRQSFDAAGITIRETITAPLQTVGLPEDFTNLSQCGLPGHPDIKRSAIRGLRIYVVVEPIDGPSGTLGQAGPCLVRGNDLPALGIMRFDEADVAALQASGRLGRVVLHEMLHVVGVGTVWFERAVLDTTTDPTNARFTGPLARQACATDLSAPTSCATSVPVHSTDGDGSRFSHWRESVFDTELMTPFLDNTSPYSRMTVQSLADLGYEVDVDVADAFTSPTSLMAPSLRATPTGLAMPEPMLPRWKLEHSGRMRPYRGNR